MLKHIIVALAWAGTIATHSAMAQVYDPQTGQYYGNAYTPPPPPMPQGAIDVTTGQYLPPAAGGVTNPQSGAFYQSVAGGYIDTQTGAFMPSW